MPLSTELADAVLAILGDPAAPSRHPEMRLAMPLIELQQRWSALPAADTLLLERYHTREGYHLFAFTFAGRLANEGIATLLAARWAQETPAASFAVGANDYGFELLAQEEFAADEARLRAGLRLQDLATDLVGSVNLSELGRRQFRDIARVAGLVFPGYPGRGKAARQLQASASLVFDVLQRYDAENLLLAQARREVLDAQLDLQRMSAVLEKLAARRIIITTPPRLTPLAFPLWADRLQNQLVSTETWQARVERAARELEVYATRTVRAA